jgi:hypothetical protein
MSKLTITCVYRKSKSAAGPFRKLYPHIFMMQSAEDWDGDDVAGPLDNSLQRCIAVPVVNQIRTY